MEVNVAISDSFMDSLVKLQKAQQKKTTQFLSKFRQNPTSSGINYEKILDAANPDMRSVRIDQTYRGIVLKPKDGNLYLLLWVDHHDAAYDWARRHECKIHPRTGILQVFGNKSLLLNEASSIHEQEEASEDKKDTSEGALFTKYSEMELIDIGLPKELIPLVRQFQSLESLVAAKLVFPIEAYEALYLMAEGVSYEEILEDYQSDINNIDVDDYAAALQREGSKRRFVIADDHALQQIIDAPLEKWRIFLHPSQRKLVERDWNGPTRVLGGAGTGKTVTAIHRTKWLAGQLSRDSKPILFTTFTKNLASDIHEHLKQICSSAELVKVEVVNIDSWVMRFLKRSKYNYQIVYPSDNNPNRLHCWQKAISNQSAQIAMSNHFYEEEWRLVIQEQSIKTKSDYLSARRLGRGTSLNRKERTLIWSVFEEYINQLENKKIREMPDAINDCLSIMNTKNIKPMYSSIIVDEGQDIGSQAYKLLRMLVEESPNDLFVVGDGHQRIYRNKVVLGHCGINIVGRGKKLRINYRTTEETKLLAVSVLNNLSVDDLDNGSDNSNGYISLMHGDEPELLKYDSFKDEAISICEKIEQLRAAGALLKDICLVARTNRMRDDYSKSLRSSGIPTYEVKQNGADNRDIEGVRVATMHRVKGLEFQNILIVGASTANIPISHFQSDDPVEQREQDLAERALLHVAMTRAIRSLIITCNGTFCKYLQHNKTANHTQLES